MWRHWRAMQPCRNCSVRLLTASTGTLRPSWTPLSEPYATPILCPRAAKIQLPGPGPLLSRFYQDNHCNTRCLPGQRQHKGYRIHSNQELFQRGPGQARVQV